MQHVLTETMKKVHSSRGVVSDKTHLDYRTVRMRNLDINTNSNACLQRVTPYYQIHYEPAVQRPFALFLLQARLIHVHYKIKSKTRI